MAGLVKTQIYSFISFIIFLIIVIISGRILNKINESNCTDPNIKDAHKWAAWTVGLSATAAGISLIIFIGIFFAGA